eukprot:4927343-Heterocapsa_arctica.AAC.1
MLGLSVAIIHGFRSGTFPSLLTKPTAQPSNFTKVRLNSSMNCCTAPSLVSNAWATQRIWYPHRLGRGQPALEGVREADACPA